MTGTPMARHLLLAVAVFLAVSVMAAAQQAVSRGAAPMWIAGGLAFPLRASGPNVSDTQHPPYSFADATGSGVSLGGAGSLNFSVAGLSRLELRPEGLYFFDAKDFVNLGSAFNGTLVYCLDCTFANPCAGGGTGAFAKRINGAWRCD